MFCSMYTVHCTGTLYSVQYVIFCLFLLPIDSIQLDPSLSNLCTGKLSSFTVLLVHEIHSFNRMVAAMRQGLHSCLQAMQGNQVMSEYVENIVDCISSDILMEEIKVCIILCIYMYVQFRRAICSWFPNVLFLYLFSAKSLLKQF